MFKNKLFIQLLFKQLLRVGIIFLMPIILLIFHQESVYLIIYQGVMICILISILFILIRVLKTNKIKVITTIFILIGISFSIARIVDLLVSIHWTIKYFSNGINFLILSIVIIIYFSVEIWKIIRVTSEDSLEKVIKINEKLVIYLDEGVFYDDYGCGLLFFTLNTIFVTLVFILGIGYLLSLMPNTQLVSFQIEFAYYFLMILPLLLAVISFQFFMQYDYAKRNRTNMIFHICLLCNIVLDFFIYSSSKLFYLIFLIQIIGVFFYVLGKVKELYFDLRISFFNDKISNMKERYEKYSKSLKDILLCPNRKRILNICGKIDFTQDFIETVCAMQKQIIKCGKVLKEERNMYYDYIIRIDYSSCEDAEDACEQANTLLKEYFKRKYGFLLWRKYAIALLNKIGKINASFLKNFGSPEFDKDCSRLNLIFDNYHGYTDQIEMTRKLCLYAAKLNINLIFVSEKKVQKPNESFNIDYYPLKANFKE